jgi:hypothetical protein
MAFAILVLATGAGRASAQVLGSPVPITLSVNQSSSLTVTVQSGAVQTLTGTALSDAITNFPAPVQILTAWDFRPNTVSSLSLVAFFATPSAALAGPYGVIGSNRIEGQISSSTGPATPLTTSWASFTGNPIGANGVPGGSLQLWNLAINSNAASVRKSQQTNRLDLRLNLLGVSLPTGTYSGTLVIRAMAL